MTADPRRLPDRGTLQERRTGYLVKGRSTKADVWLSALDDGTPVVVKEYRVGRFPVSVVSPLTLWGRIHVHREAKFLRLLADVREVPKLLGVVDRFALAMSYMPGRTLLDCADAVERGEVLQQLSISVEKIHARGVAHLDLRNRENARIVPEGRVALIDWASAVHLPPGTLRHRLFFRAFRAIDISAVIKWKQLLAPETVSDADLAFLRTFRFWRRLWPLNRKGLGEIGER